MSNTESLRKKDKFWVVQNKESRKQFEEEATSLDPLMAITFFASVDEIFAYSKMNPNDIPDGILITLDRPDTDKGEELKKWADDRLVRLIKHYAENDGIVAPFGIGRDVSLQATIELLKITTLL